MESYQQNNIPFHLILAEMERELTPIEAAELEQWKTAAPEHLVIYNTLKNAEDQLELLNFYRSTDTDDGWNKMQAAIEDAQVVAHTLKPKQQVGRYILIAGLAAAVICAIAVILFKWITPEHLIVYQTTKDQRSHIILPDSSSVFLNENSAISIQESNFQKKRHVKLLKGEAYFDVVHDAKNDFLVELEEVIIKDIGTSFNLKVDSGKIETIVSSGIVSMEHLQPIQSRQSATTRKVILAANEMGVFDRQTKQLTFTKEIPLNYKAWQDKKLRYSQTPLEIVFRDLKKLYGTQIVLNDTAIKEKKLTAFLDKKTEDQIMQIIATSVQPNLIVVKKDGIFILSQQ
jgi:ferric-dicitrate binding protein FerR (iron transport regulator)